MWLGCRVSRSCRSRPRRQEVVALADEVGHHSARARQVAAYATRPDKNTSTDPEDLPASWKRTLDAVGLTEKAVEEMAAGRPASCGDTRRQRTVHTSGVEPGG